MSVAALESSGIQSQGQDAANFYPQSESLLQVNLFINYYNLSDEFCRLVYDNYNPSDEFCRLVYRFLLVVCVSLDMSAGASDSAPGSHRSHPDPAAAAAAAPRSLHAPASSLVFIGPHTVIIAFFFFFRPPPRPSRSGGSVVTPASPAAAHAAARPTTTAAGCHIFTDSTVGQCAGHRSYQPKCQPNCIYWEGMYVYV